MTYQLTSTTGQTFNVKSMTFIHLKRWIHKVGIKEKIATIQKTDKPSISVDLVSGMIVNTPLG